METLFIICTAIQLACAIAIGVLLLWRRKTKKNDTKSTILRGGATQ